MAMRTYGLSGSGMDVDQMVKDMMKAQRATADKTWQKKTQLEWKKTDYNNMYNTLREFRDKTAFNYKLQSTTVPKKISSTAEGVVSATANSDAVNVSHDINVTGLATGVKLTSSGAISSGLKDSLATQFGIGSDAFNIKLTNGTASETIVVDPTKSIYDLVSSINNAGIGIKANYDATIDRFFLNTSDTGANVGIDFAGSSPEGLNFIKDNLKLDTSIAHQGKDAAFTLDGAALTQASNSFTISGITYNLKATGSASIVVSPDNDKAISTVKTFIDTYNAMLEKINGELKETKNKNYLPLTQEMKSAMKDTEIVEWEKMAKSGMLRRDPLLQDAVYKMRSDISNPVSGLTGKYNSLSSIGITTGDYSEGGKLYVDETKLKKALEDDPDVVYKIFGTNGESKSSQGVATRLYDTLKTTMDKVYNEAGLTAGIEGDTKSALAGRIRSYETELYKMNSRLQTIESRYYKQFDAMEKALSKLNQQSTWMMQQFSSN